MPAGTGSGGPVLYCNGDVGVPEALHLMPAPVGERADSKRNV